MHQNKKRGLSNICCYEIERLVWVYTRSKVSYVINKWFVSYVRNMLNTSKKICQNEKNGQKDSYSYGN